MTDSPPPAADQTPLVAGPLYGLRTWVVVGAPDAERLAGPHSAVPWPDGGAWLEAACARDAGHAAPERDCVCGLHAWHPGAASARRVLATRREVAGVVECHGTTEIHPDGFRAQRGRPHALVVTPMRNAALVGRLARAYDARVVTVDGPRELAAWCRERGLGLDASVVDELLGPGAVAAWREASRRRARRLVAGVAAWVAVVVLLALLASFAFPDPQGPHVVRGRSGEVTIRQDGGGAPNGFHAEVAFSWGRICRAGDTFRDTVRGWSWRTSGTARRRLGPLCLIAAPRAKRRLGWAYFGTDPMAVERWRVTEPEGAR